MFTNLLTTLVSLLAVAKQVHGATYGPGDVFALVTSVISDSSNVNIDHNSDTPVYIYADGSLGLNETLLPFEGVLFQEYGLVLVPQPLGVLDIDAQNKVKVAGSLYNPSARWSIVDDKLFFEGLSTAVVCPYDDFKVSWGASEANCQGAVLVELRLVQLEAQRPQVEGDVNINENDTGVPVEQDQYPYPYPPPGGPGGPGGGRGGPGDQGDARGGGGGPGGPFGPGGRGGPGGPGNGGPGRPGEGGPGGPGNGGPGRPGEGRPGEGRPGGRGPGGGRGGSSETNDDIIAAVDETADARIIEGQAAPPSPPPPGPPPGAPPFPPSPPPPIGPIPPLPNAPPFPPQIPGESPGRRPPQEAQPNEAANDSADEGSKDTLKEDSNNNTDPETKEV